MCTVAQDDALTTISCPDGTEVEIPHGADGAGCSVTDNGDGSATVASEDGSEYIVHDGTNGTDGTDGEKGDDGSACSITDNGNGSATISCDDGTEYTVQDGEDGQDAQPCTVTSSGDGAHLISCPNGSETILFDGENGENGEDGASCAIADNGDDTFTLSCEDGSSAIIPAVSNESCTITDNGDNTATLTCPNGSQATFPLAGPVIDPDPDPDPQPDSGVIIELSWTHPDFILGTNGPDLDLFYCNRNYSTSFPIPSWAQSDKCVFWRNTSAQWDDDSGTVQVELIQDSVDPSGSEVITHDLLTSGQTHLGVHFYPNNSQNYPNVEATLSITIDGVTWYTTTRTISSGGAFWYAGIIEWAPALNDTTFSLAPDCSQSVQPCNVDDNFFYSGSGRVALSD